ncbi:hypothetical protein GCM10022221_31140 [Actinocorallia aurea]
MGVNEESAVSAEQGQAGPGVLGEVSPVPAPRGVCGLDGCELPLPPAGRGRPPKYCSKAHADQASRERRAADAALVEEPLKHAEALAQHVPAAIAVLQAQLAELTGFLDKAQTGALARVERAEAETRSARQAAADAEARADSAESAAVRAVEEARADRTARASAERDAVAARAEAERVRADAAERVEAHQQARAAAEAARTSAEQARDGAVSDLVEARRAREHDAEHARARLAELTALLETRGREGEQLRHALTEAREALADVRGQATAQQARAEAAEADLHTARREAAETGTRLAGALEQATAQAAAARAEADQAVAALAETRAAAAATAAVHARLEADLAAARADAGAQRERAALAEARAAALNPRPETPPSAGIPQP